MARSSTGRRWKSLEELASRLGPGTEPAVVAFEACREAWFVHDKLQEWGHDPRMLDTTRVRQMGVGQHRRKNDTIDAETIAVGRRRPDRRGARAVAGAQGASGSAERARSSGRDTRAVRDDHPRPGSRGRRAAAHVRYRESTSPRRDRRVDDGMVRPALSSRGYVAMLGTLETQLVVVEHTLAGLAEKDPVLALLATVPGVGTDRRRHLRLGHRRGKALQERSCGRGVSWPRPLRIDDGRARQASGWARSPSKATGWRAPCSSRPPWTISRLRDQNDPLKRWVDHVAETRHKRIAVVGLARKLAGVLWAMWRDGTFYDPKEHAGAGRTRRAGRSASQQMRRAQALQQSAIKLCRPPGSSPPRTPPNSVTRRR